MPRVKFEPPLWLQRQTWLLSQLHLHQADSILELGCSTAPILETVFPAPLYISPSLEWRESGKKATKLAKHVIFEEGVIAPRKVVIMDIDFETLQVPIDMLRREVNRTGSTQSSNRWYDLQVKVIGGSLDENFKEQVGQVDVVIAAEVIEHLDEPVLSRFAPSILGMYRPKVLLVTTPNFSFNQRFDTDLEGKFADPTGRTDRFFRHDDHKFEWTESEFKEWCYDAACSHKYTVTIDGVGIAEISGKYSTSFSEVGDSTDMKSAEGLYASQTALFIRLDGEFKGQEAANSTSSSSAPLQSDECDRSILISPPAEPTVDLDFVYPSQQLSIPQDNQKDDIVEATKDAIADSGRLSQKDNVYESDLWSVWMSQDVRFLTHGRIDVWFDAMGITFNEDSFTCRHDIQMQVKEEDLMLSFIDHETKQSSNQ